MSVMVAACACATSAGSGVRPEAPPTSESPSRRPDDELTARAFGADALASCNTDLEYLNHVMGWQVQWPRQWQAIARADRVTDDQLERWATAPRVLLSLTEKLQRRAGGPGTAPAPVVRRVLQQIEDLADALAGRAPEYYRAPAPWPSRLDAIEPAVERFRDMLRDHYLPRASETPGLHALPGGRECFSTAVRWWTSLAIDPETIVATGERLLDESRRALEGTSPEPLEAILQGLRRPDPRENRVTLIDRSVAALSRAQRAAERAFEHVPTAPEVVPMEAHLQASFPAGYYAPGPPPMYVVNPSRPGSRRLMAEVIAFHEGIPGHHLFAAYPREGHRGAFNSGLLEGWAIYSEYLADELGLYSSTYDRQGMIAKHLWAASRLLIEPGLHLHGWSRARAIDYMHKTTTLAKEEIELEVDRYIAMPGQSLSYMLGYDAIARARAYAERALGPRFDLRAFHRVAVEPGRRTLGVMRDDVERWVAEIK